MSRSFSSPGPSTSSSSSSSATGCGACSSGRGVSSSADSTGAALSTSSYGRGLALSSSSLFAPSSASSSFQTSVIGLTAVAAFLVCLVLAGLLVVGKRHYRRVLRDHEEARSFALARPSPTVLQPYQQQQAGYQEEHSPEPSFASERVRTDEAGQRESSDASAGATAAELELLEKDAPLAADAAGDGGWIGRPRAVRHLHRSIRRPPERCHYTALRPRLPHGLHQQMAQPAPQLPAVRAPAHAEPLVVNERVRAPVAS